MELIYGIIWAKNLLIDKLHDLGQDLLLLFS